MSTFRKNICLEHFFWKCGHLSGTKREISLSVVSHIGTSTNLAPFRPVLERCSPFLLSAWCLRPQQSHNKAQIVTICRTPLKDLVASLLFSLCTVRRAPSGVSASTYPSQHGKLILHIIIWDQRLVWYRFRAERQSQGALVLTVWFRDDSFENLKVENLRKCSNPMQYLRLFGCLLEV